MDLYYFENDILHFYDIETDGEIDALLAAILKYAESIEKDDFIKEVRTIFGYGEQSGRGVIYEALSKKPENWADFFVEEYKLSFQAAENNSAEAYDILEGLEEVSFAEDTGFGDEISNILEPYLNNQNAAIRYKAIWCIGSWIGASNEGKYLLLINKIKEKLYDKHWKIRCMTKGVLEDLEELPTDFK
ncbi:MAG: hypothetical protein ACI9XO_004528, partial [Paraglaciecola sp.]